MKRKFCLLLIAALVLTLVGGCSKKFDYDPLAGVETTTIADDYGRDVKIPASITRIAASGATAQMILMTLVPDLLVGLSSSPTTDQMPYFPESMWYLPTFGQFYGTKSNLNIEALIAAQPQVIIDLGDPKDTGKNDMNSIYTQTGIPAFFFDGTLERLPETYRRLGKIFGREEKAEKLASYIEETLRTAEENSARIPQTEKLTVMFGTGATGLACNAAGSSQADVIDIVGAVNAIRTDDITNKGGGTTVGMEEVYNTEPDVILLTAGGPYDTLAAGEWSGLRAVRTGKYYEIPNLPYNWMASPPSVNRLLGVWWLGNLLYPDMYHYDMVAKAQEFYQLFWNYDLTEAEARAMLAKSTFK